MPHRLPHRGFTLIEIMVVMVILGVLTWLVTVNFAPDQRQQLQQEAGRLALLMEYASNNARTSGQAIAWKKLDTGYGYLHKQPDGLSWKLIGQNETLRPRVLPADIQVSEQKIAGNRMSNNEMIVFSATGNNAPFSITLSSAGMRVIVTGDPLGKVTTDEATQPLLEPPRS